MDTPTNTERKIIQILFAICVDACVWACVCRRGLVCAGVGGGACVFFIYVNLLSNKTLSVKLMMNTRGQTTITVK